MVESRWLMFYAYIVSGSYIINIQELKMYRFLLLDCTWWGCTELRLKRKHWAITWVSFPEIKGKRRNVTAGWKSRAMIVPPQSSVTERFGYCKVTKVPSVEKRPAKNSSLNKDSDWSPVPGLESHLVKSPKVIFSLLYKDCELTFYCFLRRTG